MCTGRVDLSFITRALGRGADGVIIGGCWPGECHYVTEGNYDAFANVHLCKRLLDRVGIRRERLRIEWIGASEGQRFAAIMSEMTEQVRALGPVGQAEGETADAAERARRLAAVDRLLPWIRLVESERLRVKPRTTEAIEAFYGSAEADRLFDELIGDKLTISRILLLLNEGPLPVAEISHRLGLSSSDVARHLKQSSGKGLVRYDQALGSYGLAR